MSPFVGGIVPASTSVSINGVSANQGLMIPFNTALKKDSGNKIWWSIALTDNIGGVQPLLNAAAQAYGKTYSATMPQALATKVVSYCAMQEFLTSSSAKQKALQIFGNEFDFNSFWPQVDPTVKEFNKEQTVVFSVYLDLTQSNPSVQKIPFGTNAVVW